MIINENYIFFQRRQREAPENGEHPETEDTVVPRNFRYMRRRPTIISYKPPDGT